MQTRNGESIKLSTICTCSGSRRSSLSTGDTTCFGIVWSIPTLSPNPTRRSSAVSLPEPERISRQKKELIPRQSEAQGFAFAVQGAGDANGAASLGCAAAGGRDWVESPSAGGLEKEARADGGASSAPPGAHACAGKRSFGSALDSGRGSGRHTFQGFLGQERAGCWPPQHMQRCRSLGHACPTSACVQPLAMLKPQQRRLPVLVLGERPASSSGR